MNKLWCCVFVLVSGCSLLDTPDPVVCPPPKVVVVPKIVVKAIPVPTPDPHAPVYITPLGLPKPSNEKH